MKRRSQMYDLSEDLKEYQNQLKKGQIQRAYKGIMKFMTKLASRLKEKYPDHALSALYSGYMDMSYFSFTPLILKARKLKIAVVYLHEENRFEVWLAGVNRKVQQDTADLLSLQGAGDYELSKTAPGTDSIIRKILVSDPKISDEEELMEEIEKKVLHFIIDMKKITE